MNPPHVRAMIAVETPASSAKETRGIQRFAFSAERQPYNARNIKRNAADSFSGMPAMVRGSNAGMTVRKNEAMSAIMLAFVVPKLSWKMVRTNKKKAMTVKANIATG